ncbi:aminotransferase class I/II-fold pyridoxal phosphate-dependent enzyme [Gryllotalpicola ginsengisoli]|uniref:aminotransferase class I/II-fold pyridoxal phosphate-dependent enzyme n=1 Tax=Gryllotalpicola ginsengisoli TaxID=444608 RepID=UPI00048963CE|nr:amino acid decarboxylase [Gryllotalpicola ginsengisoli]
MTSSLPDPMRSPTPYAEALRQFAARDVLRLIVPGHAADPVAVPELAEFFGEQLLRLDVAPLVSGIDLGLYTPYEKALDLAAEAWGAARTWFLTNGSSQANRIAALALGFLGRRDQPVVAQRSAHSSWVDGMIIAGLDVRFVQPAIDLGLGIAHGVSPEALDRALAAAPDAKAAYIVSPSYFGATPDVAGLARVAHEHGVPLVVDAAWGAHYGFHPALPPSPVREGADLAIMSTHKLGGSLTQSAMLHLGHGPFAEVLAPHVDRAFVLEQSTSESAILLASLDLARQHLQTGAERIGASLEAAERLRETIRQAGRFRVASDHFDSPDIVAVDPSRVSIDVGAGGLLGHAVRAVVLRDHDIQFEIATDACVVAIVGPGMRLDVERVAGALHELAADDPEVASAGFLRAELPEPGERRMLVREAAFAPSVIVSAAEAVGRISADSLAAYPPGIPNVMPGEAITAETVEFLQHVAAAPTGFVRGALDPAVAAFRVVA